jgi:hypothetical protein
VRDSRRQSVESVVDRPVGSLPKRIADNRDYPQDGLLPRYRWPRPRMPRGSQGQGGARRSQEEVAHL